MVSFDTHILQMKYLRYLLKVSGRISVIVQVCLTSKPKLSIMPPCCVFKKNNIGAIISYLLSAGEIVFGHSLEYGNTFIH